MRLSRVDHVAGGRWRRPHRWIAVGDSLYVYLGNGFTLIRCGGAEGPSDDGGLIAAVRDAGVPLTVLDLTAPAGRSTSAPRSSPSVRTST